MPYMVNKLTPTVAIYVWAIRISYMFTVKDVPNRDGTVMKIGCPINVKVGSGSGPWKTSPENTTCITGYP